VTDNDPIPVIIEFSRSEIKQLQHMLKDIRLSNERSYWIIKRLIDAWENVAP
jgi:hypothetical protein